MPEFVFDHIHLRSTDPQKTAEFYEKMFGATVIRSQKAEGGRGASARLELSGVTILIAQVKEGEPAGLHHFGIRTTGLENKVDGLKGKGVKFTQEVRVVNPTFKMSFLTAPDNVPIELQEGQI
jgi:lactoylglutathione lyase